MRLAVVRSIPAEATDSKAQQHNSDDTESHHRVESRFRDGEGEKRIGSSFRIRNAGEPTVP
jgi:hypothetical protein